MAVLVALLSLPGNSQPSEGDYPFHSPAPAGYNVILLMPARVQLSILGLVECPDIEGAQRVSHGLKSFLVSTDGAPLKHYPQEFSFRITATLRKTLLDGPSEIIATKYDPKQFLLNLRFRLKIYHGLERQQRFPRSVKIIGMPGDVPYDERVFRVNFALDNVPIGDRMVIEILSPEDEVLTHFTFGLL